MTFQTLVGNLIRLINSIIPLLVTLAIVLFFWGLINYIYRSGDKKGHSRGIEMLRWGLLAIFVLMSLWGILRLLCVAFIGNASCVAAWQ